jgi:hypothetical protein
MRVMKNVLDPSNWRDALREPAYPSHLLQIVDSDEILAAGAGFFATEGLRQGQAVILTGTKPHLEAIRGVIRNLGIDPDAAERNEQLFVGDAMEAVQAVMVNDLPDRARFEAIASGAIEKARRDPRYRGVRWWGEMSNVFHQLGKKDAVAVDEQIGDDVCRRHNVALLCSFQIDRLDPKSYEGAMQTLCCHHEHLMPANDDSRERTAVNRAITEVIGSIEGRTLESLIQWKAPMCHLPQWQVLLFWVRDTMPERFPAVLKAARAYAG